MTGVAVAFVLVAGLGLLVAHSAGASAPHAMLLAVPCGWALLGLLAAANPLLGLSYRPLVVGVEALALIALARVARPLVRRLLGARPDPQLAAAAATPAADARLVLRSLLATTASACVVLLLATKGDFEVVSQTWDGMFHANAVAYAMQSGLAGPRQVQAFTGSGGDYYPTGFLSVAALMGQLLHVDAVVATNVAATLVAGALWPSAVIAAARALLGPSRRVTVAAAVLSLGVWGMPWAPLGWGVLWPMADAAAYGPWALVATIRLSRWQYPRAQFAPLGLVAAATALGQPRALVTTAFLCLVAGASVLVPAAVRRARSGRPQALGGLGLVAALGLLGVYLFTRWRGGDPKFQTIDWPREETFPTAILGQLLAMPEHTLPTVAVSLLLPLGLVVAWRDAQWRWVGATWLVLVLVDAATSTLRSPLLSAVTRFWYNDRFRSATMVALPAVLLAAIAIGWLHERLPDRLRVASRARALVAAVLALAAVIPAIGSAAGFLGDRYAVAAETSGRSLVSPEEQAFLRTLGSIVPSGELVLDNAADGSALMLAYAGVRPVFATMTDATASPNGVELLARVRAGNSEARTCNLFAYDHIRWVLASGASYTDRGVTAKPALVIAPGYPLLTQVAATPSGRMRLYQVTGCPAVQ